MKKFIAFILIAGTLMLSILACGRSAPTAAPVVTPDIDAAISTSVAATSSAQQALEAALEATIAASVAETQAAAMPTAGSEATATPAAAGIEMTEEELAALIDAAVAEAVLAMEDTSTATTEATSDGSLDQAETETVYVTATLADETVAYALDLVAEYEEYYGELAEESLALMQELESDLEEMNSTLDTMVTALEEINTSLQQGLEVATETITQLQTTAQAAYDMALEAQAQAQGYVENLAAQMEGRASAALGVMPDNIPADLPSSLQAAFAYLDTANLAMSDNKVTGQELGEIARLGANASAGLQQHGGERLSSLGETISGPQGITAQLARGQYNGARDNLGGLERSLGNRPGGGGGGGRRP